MKPRAIGLFVVDTSGLPVAGVYIFVSHPAEGTQDAAETRQDGRFTLHLPAVGGWSVMANDTTGRRKARLEDVTPGRGEIVLRLAGP